MSKIFISDTPDFGWRWRHITHRLVQWRRRARARHELQGLSDATLQDLGLARRDAERESVKPFWMV
jgi:uncharacterized protein YjiS (DUF1127 family)